MPSSGRQKGYSIIELSIALAIVSIILVTALTGVQRILRTNNLNEELKRSNLLVAKLTTLLASTTSTSGVTNANLISMKVFEDYPISGSNVNNGFSGSTVLVLPNTAIIDNTPAGTGLLLYYRDIPGEVCADFINGIANLSTNISTTAGSVTPSGATLANTVKSSSQAITLSGLTTACATTSTNKVTVAALITSNGVY